MPNRFTYCCNVPIGVVHFFGQLRQSDSARVCSRGCVPKPALPSCGYRCQRFLGSTTLLYRFKEFASVMTELEARYGDYLLVISAGHSPGARLQVIQHCDTTSVYSDIVVGPAHLFSRWRCQRVPTMQKPVQNNPVLRR